jgi:hypothetical protein
LSERDATVTISSLYKSAWSIQFNGVIKLKFMKTIPALAIAFALIGFSTSARAAGGTYQATGPVLEVTASKIVIQKDTEKWEIARTPSTKVTGELKVGSKVTIYYTMTAASVEVKAPAAPEKKPK